MSRERDPLGKRALFSGGSSGTEDGAGAEETAPNAARMSSASSPKRKHGPLDVTVACSACTAISTVSAPEIALKHLPVVAWLPWRKQSLLMRCPACKRLVWHAVSRPT
jgi:hypothetical protein